MNSRCLLTIFSLMALSNFAASDDKNNQLEGFDYKRGKLEGRATIAGRLATIEITGDAAEAMYHQISASPEVDVGCTRGTTKRFRGLSCTKLPENIKASSQYECWAYLNLKTGNTTSSGEACPDLEHEDPYWDAKGNKAPRIPDFTDLEDK